MKIELIHGDCLEKMKLIPDNYIDCIITDPPYGITPCKWDSVIDFELMWVQLKRITKDNGTICLFGSEPFTSKLIVSNLKMFKYNWVWHKNKAINFLNAKKQPMRIYENISIFYKKQCLYKPQGLIYNTHINTRGNSTETNRKHGLSNKAEYSNYPNNILKFNCENTGLHPTQKPVELLEYFIKTYTLENETVLDFTMGSGSTGIACKNLSRNFIGIEQDDKYFNISKKRINDNYQG